LDLPSPLSTIRHPVHFCRVRWTTSGSPNSAAAPLCPADCSGRGLCARPPQYRSPYLQPDYNCICNSGYAGPYCQGPQQSLQLNDKFSSDSVILQPGAWMFYQVTFPASMYNNLFYNSFLSTSWSPAGNTSQGASGAAENHPAFTLHVCPSSLLGLTYRRP
jgi:hypothetical protein